MGSSGLKVPSMEVPTPKGIGDFLGQVMGLGLFDYEPSTGSWNPGFTLRALDEGVGEVTGRNQMREQMALSEARYQEGQANRQQALADERVTRGRMDRAASQAAGAARRIGNMRGGGAGGPSRGTEDMMTRDFLGL